MKFGDELDVELTGKLFRRTSARETWNMQVKLFSRISGKDLPKKLNSQRGWYAVKWTEFAIAIRSPTKTKVPTQFELLKSRPSLEQFSEEVFI